MAGRAPGGVDSWKTMETLHVKLVNSRIVSDNDHVHEDAVSMHSRKSAIKRSREAIESTRIITVSFRRIVTESVTSIAHADLEIAKRGLNENILTIYRCNP